MGSALQELEVTHKVDTHSWSKPTKNRKNMLLCLYFTVDRNDNDMSWLIFSAAAPTTPEALVLLTGFTAVVSSLEMLAARWQ